MNTRARGASSSVMPAFSFDGAASATYWLALSLSRMPAFDATEIACNWALSHHAAKRLALARALASTFPLVGDDVVLDHLSHDRIAAVRRAARQARRIRMHPPPREELD